MKQTMKQMIKLNLISIKKTTLTYLSFNEIKMLKGEMDPCKTFQFRVKLELCAVCEFEFDQR